MYCAFPLYTNEDNTPNIQALFFHLENTVTGIACNNYFLAYETVMME